MTHEPVELSAAQRALLRENINVEALERLLSALPPDAREFVYPAFAADVPDDFGIPDDARADTDALGSGVLGFTRPHRKAALPFQPADLSFEDPKLQRMLDDVLSSGSH